MLRSMIRGIKNLITWIPVIWKQREYDHIFLIKLLNKKFELMEKHMRSDNCMASVNQDKYIKQVQICKNLTRRIIANDYLGNALKRHDEIYTPNYELVFEPCEDKPGFSRLVDKRSESERKSFARAGAHANMMLQQDYNMLFDIMKKNVQGWWD